MKLFQIIQKNFAVLGVKANLSRFNGKLVKTCIIYSLGTTSSAAFLFFKAKTFVEFTSNIYVTTALAGISSYFIFWIIKLENFFKLIDNIEKFCEESELIPNNLVTIESIIEYEYFFRIQKCIVENNL